MAVTFFEAPDPFVWWQVALAGVGFFLASFIIGLFNVAGGVLFVPIMLMLPGVEPVVAVGTVFASSLPMSYSRIVQQHRNGRVKWRTAAPMMIAAACAAPLGQLTVKHVPAFLVQFLVAFIALYAGMTTVVQIWKKSRRAQAQKSSQPKTLEAVPSNAGSAAETEAASVAEQGHAGMGPGTGSSAADCKNAASKVTETNEAEEQRAIGTRTIDFGAAASVMSRISLGISKSGRGSDDSQVSLPLGRSIAIGFVGSFVSSVAGVGGPVVIMPLMLLFMPPLDMKVIVGVTSPTAAVLITFSLIGAVVFTSPDLGLAVILTFFTVSGALAGGYLQEKMSSESLRQFVAGLLVVVGLALVAKTSVEIAT